MSVVYGPVEHAVRSEIYRLFVETAEAPSVEQVADGVGLDAEEVGQAFEDLERLRAVVLRRRSRQIAMALPFSATHTPYRVRVGGLQYFANCAWDSLGIPAAMQQDAEIRCDGFAGADALRLEVRDGRVLGDDVHMGFVVPARKWWDDIGFT